MEYLSNIEVLTAFQVRWPVDRVRSMSLEEFAFGGGGHDTFCYWLEHKTVQLGSIKRAFANKFGIYRRGPHAVELRTADFMDGDDYRWWSKYGTTPQEAFATVKGLVLNVIEAVQSNDLGAISRIDLHPTFMWKVASLYDPDKIYPIFNKEVLHRICRAFDMPNAMRAHMAQMHNYMVRQVPQGLSIYDHAFAEYQRHRAEANRKRAYYVIGTKYLDEENGGYVNVYPKMRAEGVAAIGFLGEHDIGALFSMTLADARAFVHGVLPEYPNRRWDDSASKAVPRFTRIRPGDIVAFKGTKDIRQGTMTVVGYALVTGNDDGDCYNGLVDGLGQTIQVEHFPAVDEFEVHANMASTIREFKEGAPDWSRVFGPLSGLVEELDAQSKDPARRGRKGATSKNTGTGQRSGSAGGAVDFRHNRIQESLKLWLEKTHPDDEVDWEKDWMDIYHKTSDAFHIYEVKTAPTAFTCIREAIGQLLDYAHTRTGTEDLQLWVVGEASMDDRAEQFLSYINRVIGWPIGYMRYDLKQGCPGDHTSMN